MHGFSLAKIAAGLGVAAVVLAGCVAVVDERPGYDRPPPPRPGGPAVCTQEYAPVCAERRGERQTFSNACMARASNHRIVHDGACRRGGPGGREPAPRACTREYAPVCARRGRDVRTFGNACEARAADYRIVGQGRC